MDDHRLAEFLRRQCGVVTTAQLMACGLSSAGIAKRLAGARLFRFCRTVYSASPHVDDWGRRWAAVLATDPERAVLSHWSASQIHRMSDRGLFVSHVTVPGGGRRGTRGVVVHRARTLDPADVAVVRGLKVTTPERTVLDIAGLADDDEVRRTIREGEYQGVLGSGAIRDAVAGHAGHRGIGRLRRVDPGTIEAALGQTPLEDELDPILVSLGIAGLDRQRWVRGIGGTSYRVDFAFPHVRLAIEADGRTAHERTMAFETDRAREADLGAAGWQTLRFTRIQVRTTPDVVSRTVAQTVRVREFEQERLPRSAAA